MESFQEFFRENSETWIDRFDYKEAAPQLLLQAFLQRVVNGGGWIDREYGLGRGRTDLLVWWLVQRGVGSGPTNWQRCVLELMILRDSREKKIRKGLAPGRRIPGEVCRAQGASGDIRPNGRKTVGREDLPRGTATRG